MNVEDHSRTGRSSWSLALLAGGIMFLAFVSACLLTAATGITLFANIFSNSFIPSFSSYNDRIYFGETGTVKFNVFDPLKSNFISRIYLLENGQWVLKREFLHVLGGVNFEDGHSGLVFVPGELWEMNGTTIERRVPFDIGNRVVDAAMLGDTLALMGSSSDHNLAITYFDNTYKKIKISDLGKPAGYINSYMNYPRLRSDKENLWVFWQNMETIYYAPIENDAFGETQSLIGNYSSLDFVASPKRIILALDSPGKDHIKDKRAVHKLWEFADGKFEKLGKLVLPGELTPMVRFSEMDGVINAFILSGKPVRKEWVDGEWRNVDMSFPASIRDYKQEVRSRTNHAFTWAAVMAVFWLLLTSMVAVAVVDWRFKAEKDSHIFIEQGAAELASLGSRALAFFMDAIVCIIPVTAIAVVLIAITYRIEDSDFFKALLAMEEGGAMALLYLFFLPAYSTLLEVLRGKTLGKLVMGIKVVGVDGADCAWTAVLKRNLVKPFDLLFCFAPGAASMASSERMQRLGDRWAKTIVIKGGIHPPQLPQ